MPAAVVPVAVGTAVAVGQVEGGLIAWRAIAALVVALALQVATNFANDYSDGVRGTDSEDRVGPVRLVGSGLVAPGAVKRAAFASFGVAGVVGGALALAVGPELLVVGVASIAAGWFYTGGSRPYGYAGLGEVFVFVFFGLVATIGSTYVQLERIDAWSALAAVAVGALATALLVINNLRDRETDASSDKITLAVRLGDRSTRFFYVGLLFDAIVVIAVVGALWRAEALLGLVGAIAMVPPARAVLGGAKGLDLIAVLGGTGRAQLICGLLFALGLAIGG